MDTSTAAVNNIPHLTKSNYSNYPNDLTVIRYLINVYIILSGEKHGKGGPLSIERSHLNPVTVQLLKAGQEMGFKIRDPNPNGPLTDGRFRFNLIVMIFSGISYKSCNVFIINFLMHRICPNGFLLEAW